MPDLGEERRRRAADGLDGRVGSGQLGPGGLEGAELGHEGVELGVGDLRIVVDEVTPIVVVDLAPQLLGPRCGRSGVEVARPVCGEAGFRHRIEDTDTLRRNGQLRMVQAA